MRNDRPAKETETIESSWEDTVAPADPSQRTDAYHRDDRYATLGEQGRGGMGVVTRVEDRKLARVVALKELVSRHPNAHRRFEREALLTARLEHPGIVPVYEYDYWRDGTPYYTMKLIAGKSLRELIDQTEDLEQRLGLLPHVIAVCEAVAYAHANAIIHRDLKPSNVVVGDFGETMVIDWGLGKQLGDVGRSPASEPQRGAVLGTEAGAVLGTPMYMAPEQSRSANSVDARADVFALGAMLFHALAGSPPFDDSAIRDLRVRGVEAKPRSLRDLAPGAPKDLVAIVRRAMANEPAQRYADAGELARELRRFEAGQLVGARRYSIAELVARWLSAHRYQLMAVAVVAAFGAGTWSVWKAAREEPACQTARQRIEAVWSPSAAQRLETAWAAASSPVATDTLARLRPQLGGLADRWLVKHESACAATYETGEQTRGSLSLRLDCLESRRRELRALLGAYTESSTPATIERALAIFDELTPLEVCDDLDRLRAGRRVARNAGEYQLEGAVGEGLAKARALRSAGDLAAARTELDSLREAVAGLPRSAALAIRVNHEALLLLGAEGNHAASLELGWEVLERAAAAGLDGIVGGTWSHVLLDHTKLGRYDDGIGLLQPARLAALRSPQRAALGEYHSAAGYLLSSAEWLEEAATSFERAIESLEAAGVGPQRLAHTLYAAGDVHTKTGDADKARASLQRALDLLTAEVGPEHPAVGAAHNNLGNLYRHKQDFDRAAEHYRSALRIKSQTLGEDHVSVAGTLVNIGLVHLRTGESSEAEQAFLRALALTTAGLGEDHPRTAIIRANLGLTYTQLGDYERAFSHHEDALAIKRERLGPGHPSLGWSWCGLGDAARASGDYERAETAYRTAVEVFTARLGADAPATEQARYQLGLTLAFAGKSAPARALLRPLVDVFRKAEQGFSHCGALFALAMVNAQLSALERAEALAQQAIEACVAAEQPFDAAWSATVLADVMLARGRADQARASLGRASGLLDEAKPTSAPSAMRLRALYLVVRARAAPVGSAARRLSATEALALLESIGHQRGLFAELEARARVLGAD